MQTKQTPIGMLPEPLLALVTAHTDAQSVLAVAGTDLDEHGLYAEAMLVLIRDEMGVFRKSGEEWAGEWLALGRVSEAVLVEGLGMGLLRLLARDSVLAEYRFTLRHARAVARLHRQLEKQVSGEKETEEAAEEPHKEEKKTRCEKCDRVIPSWSEVCPSCLSRRKVLSRLLDFVRPYWWRAIAGFLLAFLATVSVLVRPYLTQPMLDYGLGAAPGCTADYDVLMRYIVLMAVLTLFAACAGALRERIMASLGSRIGRDIRDRTYEHLHSLSLSFFSKKPTGSLVTRVTSDSDRIWDFVAFTLIEFMISLLTIAGVGIALFVLNWKLACIVLLPIPLMLFFTILFHRKLHRGFHRLFHRWSQMTAVVSDALPGVRVIKAFSQEKREVDRFGRKNREFYEDEIGMISLWTLFQPVMQLCTQTGTLLVWIVGGYWAVQGKISAGTLMAYIAYMWMFYGPIHMIAHMDRMFNRAATSVQRIFEILDTEPSVFSPASAVAPDGLSGRIELRDVSFSYDGIRRVLKNINVAIKPGEMIGLAGPSGGGKTTMLNLICRFYDVLEGQILIDGIDVRNYEIEALRRRIGVVLQDPFLFHGTVADNIAYAHPQASRDQVIEASRAANAHEFIVGFPDGYDTMVGERGHTLSGGERQRISIARAILNNPAILILDEATSSVDTETEKQIQQALDRLVAHRTTIAIAHRLSTLRKAHRLVILKDGNLVEQGSHEELSNREDGVYAKLLNMQTEMKSIIAIE